MKWFAVMVGETRTISGSEQLRILKKCFDSDHTVWSILMQVYTLTSTIKDALIHCGL